MCTEGTPFNYVYFIRDGEFQMTKRVQMPSHNGDGEERVAVREGLNFAKDPKKKKAERDYAKNIT